MAHWILALAAAAALSAQTPAPQQPPEERPGELRRQRPEPARSDKKVEAPPEEDTAVAPTEYTFNPVQSLKDVGVGNQYYKLGNYRAAARRYQEATKWNDNNSGAWLKLAEASEKTKDKPTAREAYEKYLKLEPDAKNADDIKKRLSKLK